MAAGFRACRGRTVVSMDGDLQNDPADIGRLVEKLEQLGSDDAKEEAAKVRERFGLPPGSRGVE